MIGEAFAGLSAIKTAFDMTQGLQSIHDAVARDRAVIELQKEILLAQSAQAALLDRVSQLEKEVARFETWDAEKKRYELKALRVDVFAYMLKPDSRGVEPPHWLCANCYEQRKKSIFQWTPETAVARRVYRCPACNASIAPASEPKWLD